MDIHCATPLTKATLPAFCIFVFLFCSCTSSHLQAQADRSNRLCLAGGLQHATLLDRQATPLSHTGMGRVASLTYERRAPRHYWQVGVFGGQMAFQPVKKELRYYEPQLTALTGGISISYLRVIKEWEKIRVLAGGALNEELLVDFEGIGTWPYLSALGGVYGKARVEYNHGSKHRFGAGLSLPLLPWLTDMPHNQIPRIVGRIPDAVTLFKVGTRLAFWDSYQRVDVQFTYDYDFSKRWSLSAKYDWAWFHDAKPRDMWTYQGRLNIGITHKW